jgi:hypothetical protein
MLVFGGAVPKVSRPGKDDDFPSDISENAVSHWTFNDPELRA